MLPPVVLIALLWAVEGRRWQPGYRRLEFWLYLREIRGIAKLSAFRIRKVQKSVRRN
jgi:hypothetical protein